MEQETSRRWGVGLISGCRYATVCHPSSAFVIDALSPVHTSNNVEATLSNATNRTIFSTKYNVASTLLTFLACSLFRLCRKDEISQKTCSSLLPKTATTLSKQYSSLSKESFDLLHSTMLFRQCCCCERGFGLREQLAQSRYMAAKLTETQKVETATSFF